MPLQRSGKDFTLMKVLPAGVYQYRFFVDGQWRYAPELPWAQDDSGNAYNVLDLQVTDNIEYANFLEKGKVYRLGDKLVLSCKRQYFRLL